MAVKLILIASLAVVLVMAELPKEEKDISKLSPNSFDSSPLETSNIKEKREAIADPKKNNKPEKNKKNKKNNNKAKGNKRKGSKRKNKKNPSRKRKNKGKKLNKNKKRNGKKSNDKKKKKNNRKTAKKKKEKPRRKGKGRKKKGKSKNRKGKKPKKNRKGKNKKKEKKKNRKTGKSGKKNKDKQSRNNKNNKGKKNKKSKQKNRNKLNKAKSRKNKKSKKSKAGKRGKAVQQRQTEKKINLTCLRDAITATKFLKDNVGNFLQQFTRLEKQNSLTNKKAGKKGEFKEPAARLIQSGGGDRSNLSCGGSTTSVGAKSLKTVTDTLDACEVSIKNACKPPSFNKTTFDTCKTNALKFNKTVSGCVTSAQNGKDACSCFQDAEVAKELKILRKCKGQSTAKSAAKARSACVKEVIKCKNASTTAATLQYACSHSKEKLMKTLAQLSKNSAAFKALLAKVKELTGLSPNMPGSNSTSREKREDEEDEVIFDSQQARLRGKRQQQACSVITTTITTCTTTIVNTPALSIVVTKCKAPTFTIAECTTEDKTAIQKALDEAPGKQGIIIAFMDSIKAELKAMTGSTPSTSDINASGGGSDSTAKAASRSRNVLRKMIMDKIQLHN